MHTSHLRIASIASALAAWIASPATADADTLRARGSLRTGLRIDHCASPNACEPWVQYPPAPARSAVEVRASSSGRYFYVWSTPDRRRREVDVYERPRAPGGAAVRVGHWAPGFGGELRWTPGDRLFHTWGCGTSCVNGNLYDVRGATLRSVVGSAIWTSADGRHAAVANHGGDVVVVEFEHGRVRRGSSRRAARTFPVDVAWGAGEVRVRYAPDDTTAGAFTHVRLP